MEEEEKADSIQQRNHYEILRWEVEPRQQGDTSSERTGKGVEDGSSLEMEGQHTQQVLG